MNPPVSLCGLVGVLSSPCGPAGVRGQPPRTWLSLRRAQRET